MDALIDKPMPETTTTRPNPTDLKSRLMDRLSILNAPMTCSVFRRSVVTISG